MSQSTLVLELCLIMLYISYLLVNCCFRIPLVTVCFYIRTLVSFLTRCFLDHLPSGQCTPVVHALFLHFHELHKTIFGI